MENKDLETFKVFKRLRNDAKKKQSKAMRSPNSTIFQVSKGVIWRNANKLLNCENTCEDPQYIGMDDVMYCEHDMAQMFNSHLI